MKGETIDLSIAALTAAYGAGRLDPRTVVAEVYRRIATYPDPAVWIAAVLEAEALARADAISALPPEKRGPLYGIPFAVKDNIDVAGMETTVACPGAAYRPSETAQVVERLQEAGAILIGKTNLDQFATGLVGVRSPYGAPRCVFDDAYISGGSSSGSGVAVAAGLVSFALGTDTAGSGRVPAAFNNIVGVKPTRGLISTRGAFPACRSLDCISVFGLTTADADAVRRVAQGFDRWDPFAREAVARSLPLDRPRIGVPDAASRVFLGDDGAEALYDAAIVAAETLGWQIVTFDYRPFGAVAKMLYGSAWVAERLAAIRPAVDGNLGLLFPVTREVIAGAEAFDAASAFTAIEAVERLKRELAFVWDGVDAMLLPTTPSIYTVAALEADPITLNANLGTYTNFVNLLDLCAVSVPAGFRVDSGLPFGAMLVAPAFADGDLAVLADRLHRAASPSSGAGRRPLARAEALAPRSPDGWIEVAVVGAHLSGQPLNGQLTERGGRLVETTRTAGHYRLYALAGTEPPKPGLVDHPGFAGLGLEVEIWALSPAAFGTFVARVPAPLAIGTVALVDGRTVKGFVCEPRALEGAQEITEFGGWRTYRAAVAAG